MEISKGTFAPRLITMLLLCLGACGAFAHGSAPGQPLPDASVTGIERGIDIAMNCDHSIHELLFEYEYCMKGNHALIGDDAAAETAFRFLAWVRAATAQFQGYPDAEPYRDQYRRNFLAAQTRHPILSASLCKAIGIDCATLPEPVPQPEIRKTTAARNIPHR